MNRCDFIRGVVFSTVLAAVALVAKANGDAIATKAKPYPLVEKKGTFEYCLVESNPIVFKGKPYLCEHYHWQGCRFVSLLDYQVVTPVVAKGGGMACAFVDGDKLYVTANRQSEKRFVIYESDDMIHWSEPRTIYQNKAWGPYFNTSLCKADGRYVIAVELYGKVGPKCIMSFLESKDLKEWKFREDAGFTERGVKYCGSPCLKYHGGWFYFFYLEYEGHNADHKSCYRQRVVRSRDLVHWARGNRVVMDFGDDDRKVHPGAKLTPEQLIGIKTAEDRNASDFDMCEWNGNVIISYNWGNQEKVQYIALAEVKNISEREFCESFFTNP